MAVDLVALCIDANDPIVMARFWAAALRWDIEEQWDGDLLLKPTDGTSLEILFEPVPETKVGRNRHHIDLTTESVDDQEETVVRLLELGGRHLDIGQGDVPWVVMADPDGNEFCILKPR